MNGEGGERGGWPIGRVISGRGMKRGVANGRVVKVATPKLKLDSADKM